MYGLPFCNLPYSMGYQFNIFACVFFSCRNLLDLCIIYGFFQENNLYMSN